MKWTTVLLVLAGAALLAVGAGLVWGSGCRSGTASSPAITTNNNFNGQGLAESLPKPSLLDSNGSTVDVRDLTRAAPVALLVFFATYDTGWSDNVKVAEQIHRDMAKDGVLVLGINEQEPQGTLTAFVSKEGLTFPVLRDKDGSFLHAVGTLGSVEQMVVVDGSGKILARQAGNSDSIAAVNQALRARTNH